MIPLKDPTQKNDSFKNRTPVVATHLLTDRNARLLFFLCVQFY